MNTRPANTNIDNTEPFLFIFLQMYLPQWRAPGADLSLFPRAIFISGDAMRPYERVYIQSACIENVPVRPHCCT